MLPVENYGVGVSGLEVGQIVLAEVKNLRENYAAEGKARPAVVLRIQGEWVLVEGLTSQEYRKTDGVVREPVPDWESLGLNEKSYIWGLPTHIPIWSVVATLAPCSTELATKIIEVAGLSDSDAIALLVASHSNAKRGQYGTK